MARLIDTSLWIDLSRAKSPALLKAFVTTFAADPDACLAEPIIFESLRNATDAEANQLTQLFATLPLLASPADLWTRAALLGQQCRKQGITVGGMDLLISSVAIAYSAELITFDDDFKRIAGVSPLQVLLLKRP